MSKAERLARKNLVDRRNVALQIFKSKCTWLHNFTIIDENSHYKLINLLTNLKESWNELKVAQESLVSDDELTIEQFLQLENEHIDLITEVELRIKNSPFDRQTSNTPPPTVPTNSSMLPLNEVHLGLRLPALQAPTFNGEFSQWTKFRDIFNKLIHENVHLTNVEKFHYLENALTGEAQSIISNLTNTSENYQVAWQLVNERYNNPRRLASSYIANFECPPAINLKEPHSIQRFSDHYMANYKALQALTLQVPAIELMVIHRMLAHCPPEIAREWEKQVATNANPAIQDMHNFLERLFRIEENSLSNPGIIQRHPNSGSGTKITGELSKFAKCPYCKESHSIFQCQSFKLLNPVDRLAHMKKNRLCYNCLRANIVNHTCSTAKCKTCNKNHHTLLHDSFIKNSIFLNVAKTCYCTSNNPDSEKLPVSPSEGSMSLGGTISQNHQQPQQIMACQAGSSIKPTILPTVRLLVLDQNNEAHEVCALLDSGSNCNLITQQLANQLKLATKPTKLTIQTITDNETEASSIVNAKIRSKFSSWSSENTYVVVNKIAKQLPSTNINISRWIIPENILIANPTFHKPNNVDMLLGADITAHVFIPGKWTHPKLPSLINTVFGWTFMGSYQPEEQQREPLISNFIDSQQVKDELTRFWELEELSSEAMHSPEEIFCEEHFKATTSRDETGRYIVSLPIKPTAPELGDSRKQALQRYEALERKFEHNAQFATMYKDFMNEYKELGHMQPAPPINTNERNFFLPHHGVIKEQSSSTKLRTVFDASAKTSNKVSLNDILAVGPVVQPDLLNILLNFRVWPVGYSADIIKMYRQIIMNPSDRNLLRIFWRPNPQTAIQEFQLSTVTYGTACAPYQATKTLNQLADDEAADNPIIHEKIQNCFYVDNILTGANSPEEAIEHYQELTKVLDKGGFHLHKWLSNSQQLMDIIPNESKEVQTSTILTEGVSTLGLTWNIADDEIAFSCSNQQISNSHQFTKRMVLSCIAKCYDPIGLAAPVIIQAKMLLQKIWKTKIEWDDLLTPELLIEWKHIFNDLQNMNQLTAPRSVRKDQDTTEIQIHGFADASLSAYGACLYVRTTTEKGKVQCNLLVAKSRVTPVRERAISHLELCAALLLARLVKKVVPRLPIVVNRIHLYSDSTTVCAWIKSPHKKRIPFVTIRTSEIQELTNHCKWHHITSNHNPADLISRGTQLSQLRDNQLWWQGPSFLLQNSHPKIITTLLIANLTVCTHDSGAADFLIRETSNQLLQLIENCSSYNKVLRSIALCVRFIHNLRYPKARINPPILPAQLQEAEEIICKIVQNQIYKQELTALKANKPIHHQSKIKSLAPELHTDGLLRVGGRLDNTYLPFNTKHQIILPSTHRLSKLLIRQVHLQLLHAGTQSIMSQIRQKFWIPSLRRTTKGVIRSCIPCFKQSKLKPQQLMGQLPAPRVTVSPAFSHCGIDYAGPITTRLGTPRSRKFTKSYIAVFICLATKGVHLEVVSDLTSEAFLAAFFRMTNRRGIPSHMYSDNATTFKGASKQLKELLCFLENKIIQHQIQDATAHLKVTWNFIPPRSPHFGGIWEAAVKSFKRIFIPTVGNRILNYEELTSLACGIEAILNSRPLVPLTEDHQDFNYLSPAILLNQRPSLLVSSKDSEIKLDHISRWKKIQNLTQIFWKQWSQDYILTLQRRNKWHSSHPNLTEDTIVLLKEDNLPPATWKLGRISKTYPGRDGKVRVVDVTTTSGIYKRSISNICPLPQETQDSHL